MSDRFHRAYGELTGFVAKHPENEIGKGVSTHVSDRGTLCRRFYFGRAAGFGRNHRSSSPR